MEMRARESVSTSKDLTGEIAPYATALHDVFLQSHCSSCFTKLLPQPPCVVSCTICCSLRYCCSECFGADSAVHFSSGECCFFVDHLKRASPSYVSEGTSDLRAALRLLYVLEMHGLASSDSIDKYSRIGGLSASGIEKVLEEGEVIAERMLEGSLLMSSARKSRAHTSFIFSDRLKLEKMALWAVIINSVEVQLSEGLAMGVAVYGPSFSWFNHSCFPSASYRFVLAPRNEDYASQKSKSCVVPASKGVAADVWHAWQYEEDHSTHALCKYGPRVVVRCIKPINKGDEVCITYIDILQTREARHSDLWSKYKFICSCKRCIASPEPYTDLILNCDAKDLDKAEDTVTTPAIEDLGDILQQAISEYTSNDDPKACCDMIESMLSNNLSLLYLVESIKGKTRQNISEARFSSSSCPTSSTKNDSPPYHEFRSTCEAFGKQMLSLSLHCWSFLVQSLPSLEKIKNPMEFSMLGTTTYQSVLSEEDHVNLSAHQPVGFTKKQTECILSLALCCISYCKYLASICYGPQHYLSDHAKYLLEGSTPISQRPVLLFCHWKTADTTDCSGGYNKPGSDEYTTGSGRNNTVYRMGWDGIMCYMYS
ncbi:protein SET DOMAIN GROUP 41-like isoform X3 [Miscanthus floridulus]|uniref:protein SET DOMAIN GROUP 41-like isoform X3 n=1 Tax=Miscanthus floridulus TaxID=154761 RepID=UPI0034598188